MKDLNELPSIEEFEKMAGELAETEDAVPASDLPFESSQPEEQAMATGDEESSGIEQSREGNE